MVGWLEACSSASRVTGDAIASCKRCVGSRDLKLVMSPFYEKGASSNWQVRCAYYYETRNESFICHWEEQRSHEDERGDGRLATSLPRLAIIDVTSSGLLSYCSST